MRICIVAPPYVAVPPPAYGGTESVLDTLAVGLVRAGHEVLLATTGDARCPVERTWCWERAVGVGHGGSEVELRHVVDAYAAAAAWRAEVVHDHTLLGPLYARAGVGLPVVATNHGPFDVPEIAACFAAIADRVHIVAISQDHARSAPVPIRAVIHHGLDVEQVPVGTGQGGYALFLGRLHPTKGPHLAARVARRAGVDLVIAGKMQEQHEVDFFEAEVRPLLGSGIEYVGEVGASEKLELLGAARCLLNPIQWAEPFGMVMIEALACGTPVVATPFGSVPEIVTDGLTGLVRPTEDQLAVAVRAVDALDRRACRAAAEARFSAARFVADHVALYREVLAGRDAAAVA